MLTSARLKLQEHHLSSSFEDYRQRWNFHLKQVGNTDHKNSVKFSFLMESWARVSDAEYWEILFSISLASFAVAVIINS